MGRAGKRDPCLRSDLRKCRPEEIRPVERQRPRASHGLPPPVGWDRDEDSRPQREERRSAYSPSYCRRTLPCMGHRHPSKLKNSDVSHARARWLLRAELEGCGGGPSGGAPPAPGRGGTPPPAANPRRGPVSALRCGCAGRPCALGHTRLSAPAVRRAAHPAPRVGGGQSAASYQYSGTPVPARAGGGGGAAGGLNRGGGSTTTARPRCRVRAVVVGGVPPVSPRRSRSGRRSCPPSGSPPTAGRRSSPGRTG